MFRQKAFYQAIRDNDLKNVEKMLKDNANPNQEFPKGWPYDSKNTFRPLHLAAYYGHQKMVELLLKYRADIDAYAGLYRPAYYAIVGMAKFNAKNTALLDFLIENNVDIERIVYDLKNNGLEVPNKYLQAKNMDLYSQLWLSTFLKSLGYKVAYKGSCSGLTHMARQAMQARDVETFNNRLKIMKDIYFDCLFQALHESKLDPKHALLPENEAKTMLTIENKLRDLVKIRMEKHPTKVDILAFSDGVVLYQAQNYEFDKEIVRALVDPKTKHHTNEERIEKISKMVGPVIFEKDNNAIELIANKIIGAYTLKDLEDYFQMISEKFTSLNIQEPVSFKLNIPHHVNIINFDPKYKKWHFLDTNRLPIQTIELTEKSHIVLARKVATSFFSSDCAIFRTYIYASNKDKESVIKGFQELAQDKHWQSIHKITADKEKLRDGFGTTLAQVIKHRNVKDESKKKDVSTDLKSKKQLESKKLATNMFTNPGSKTLKEKTRIAPGSQDDNEIEAVEGLNRKR